LIVHPERASMTPQIDGQLDDQVWQQAQIYSEFETFEPIYGKPISETTLAMAAYDNENLYFAFKCLDSEPHLIKSSVTKWDNLFNEDWIGVALDALNDQQSAYAFMANGRGSQGDLMLGSQGGGDPSEDFIWDAAGQLTAEGYTVEMRIPLQSLRFSAGEEVTMGVAFIRRISRSSEQAAYPPFYPDKGALISQFGKIVYRDLNYERTLELLPAFTRSDAHEARGGALKRIDDISGSDVGLTAKVGLTPTLTLDLTANPDFSQIEADASQVDVNVRYDVYYQEKRPFFLEGSKNFVIAGAGQASGISQVVHTRTITDPSLGIKVTGKLGPSNALAVLAARDESTVEEAGDRPADFGIVRYKRLLKDESYVGGILTSREHMGGYNRVAGIDGAWRLSGTESMQGNVFYGVTRDPESGVTTQAHNVDWMWQYSDRDYYMSFGMHDISKDFSLATGFVPRDGTTTLTSSFQRNFYRENGIVQRISVGGFAYGQQDKYYSMAERYGNAYLRVTLPRSTYVWANLANGTEVYQGVLYERNRISAGLNGQVLKSLFLVLDAGRRGSPMYDEENHYQGDIVHQVVVLNYQPTENFSTEFFGVHEVFTDRAERQVQYDVRIFRNKTTYQLNKYLYVRGILEYKRMSFPIDDAHPESLRGEFLLGFTYIPGTVIYLGYGARFETMAYDGADYVPSDTYREMRRGLFFKASYNWRR